MTKGEFEQAWNDAPPAKIAEVWGQPNCIAQIKRPLDRRWNYQGRLIGYPLDVLIPCYCILHRERAKAKSVDYISPAEPLVTKVCCRGGLMTTMGWKWMYVGECPECKTVYWLRR